VEDKGYRMRRRDSGMRAQRRGPAAPALVMVPVIALIAALAALAGFGISRAVRHAAPAAPAARVSIVPTDAVVAIASRTATGVVAFGSLAPGSYAVRASRRGFVPLETTLVVTAGRASAATFALEPLPQQVKLTAHPAAARFAVIDADGRRHSGGSLSARLPAGPTLVTLSAPGFATLRRQVFLDGPLTLDLWLDPARQLVRTVSVFRSVPAPKGVAVTPDGSQLWVTALVTQPSIEAYDRTGKVVGKVDLGKSGAVEVCFNADGSRAYASQMQSASVYEIDTKTYQVLRVFKTNSSWTKVVALSPDGKKLYAANWSGDDISEIDLASGKCVRRFPTVDTPRGLFPTSDGKRLFVAGFGEQSLVGRIAVIDLATGKSKTIFSKSGGAMRHMVADEKRGVVFTSDMGKACLWETDMRTLKTRFFAKTDSHPNTIDLSPDGKVLFVSCRGVNNAKSYYIPGPEWGSILLIDSTTGKPLDAIVGGNQCTALDLSSDGGTLVFSDFLDNRLHVYDIPSYATLAKGRGGYYDGSRGKIRKPGWGAGGGSSGTD
jgi:DNA-binding beta-propeller fold protein YncE